MNFPPASSADLQAEDQSRAAGLPSRHGDCLLEVLKDACRYTVTLSKVTVSPLGHRGVACQHLLSRAAVLQVLKLRCQLGVKIRLEGGKTSMQIVKLILSLLKKF